MGTYVGHFRTNYFRVKDAWAFRRWVKSLRAGNGEIEVFTSGEELLGLGGDCAVPSDRVAQDADLQLANETTLPAGECPWSEGDAGNYDLSDLQLELDFFAELAAHLAAGEIAVVREVGHEKLSVLVGYARAVNHEGQIVAEVDLDDLHSRLPEYVIRPMY